MIVDDRLDTVLRTAPAGRAGARIQFRQLADILGTVRPADWTARHRAALDRLEAIHDELGEDEGGDLLRSVALVSPALVDHFSHLGGRAALGAIGGARLVEDEWLGLIPRLPVQARGALRHRRDLGTAVEALLAQLGIGDFALPMPAADQIASAPAVADAATPEAAPPVAYPEALSPETLAREGIGAIVRRIEAFRRSREERGAALATGADATHPRLPFADEPHDVAADLAAIDVQVDAEGTIVSADARVAAMLVGHRPFTGEDAAPATCDAMTLRMIRARLPVESGLVTFEGAPAVAGPWRIDAVPTFARDGGPFTGYQARLRRPAGAPASPANDDCAQGAAADDSADRLRQLLHELRTPVNAIQGFAELIQQQLFGPTPHQYRSLAASITADAARMLAGFEEVERLVKLETGHADALFDAGADEDGADVAAIVTRLIAQIDPVLAPREVRLRCAAPAAGVRVAMAEAELERTVWRLLSVVAAGAAPGERLTLALVVQDGKARLDLALPAALAMRDDATLFAPDAARGGAFAATSTLGSGFALRLASAEVRAVGGQFLRDGSRLLVDLPLLTGSARAPSQVRDPAIGG